MAATAAFLAMRPHVFSSLCFARSQCPFLVTSPAFLAPLLGRRRRATMARRGLTTRATLGLTMPVAINFPQVTFSAKEIDFAEWRGDMLAVAVSDKDLSKDTDSKFENPILKRLDDKLDGLLAETAAEEDFTGKVGQSTVLRLPGLSFKRLGLVGLGPCTPSSSITAFQGIGEAVAAAAKAAQATNAAIVLASGIAEESKINAASAIASGTVLGIYEDNRFKSESKKSLLKSGYYWFWFWTRTGPKTQTHR